MTKILRKLHIACLKRRIAYLDWRLDNLLGRKYEDIETASINRRIQKIEGQLEDLRERVDELTPFTIEDIQEASK